MTDSFRVSGKKITLPKSDTKTQFEVRPGGWVIATLADGKRTRFAIQESKGKLSALLGGRLWHGDVIQEQRKGAGSGTSDADLIAQFPGKVRKILVREGDVVEEGGPLILVEAMKMEFAIKAPFAGKVVKVLVMPDQQLAPGDRFVDLQPAETVSAPKDPK